ncbi:hypothetical protein TNCV_1915301 [Trichonephila clavipes]|uniref:Uncharacterized protein n=1 Tax=Trichonephila clavipes TaxID=2585209 RepID=A0A8X6W0F1_TRICX|nr:hypothetical protein TNCV_1915301 [Trichonephila clavipes]
MITGAFTRKDGRKSKTMILEFKQIQSTPTKGGRDEVPRSTSVLTKQNAGGAKGGCAGRKTGRPKVVNQDGDSSPQKKRCCTTKLLVLFRVWKKN